MVLKVWNFYKYLLKLLYIFFKIPWVGGVGWRKSGEVVGNGEKNKNKKVKTNTKTNHAKHTLFKIKEEIFNHPIDFS